MRRRSRAEWAEIVAEYRGSGESVEKFAAKRGLRVSSLKWWCWRVRGASTPRRSEARDEVRLVPVEVVGLAARACGPVMLAIADVEMRVDVGTDVAYVGALVRELRARC
jgi:hypothetical protein